MQISTVFQNYIKNSGLNISSVPLEIGRYQMITHKASVKFSHGQKEQ